MWVWESPPSPPQARTLVSKSRDHGNDAMVAQYVFLILGHATSWETLREMDVKNFQCYCKQQITNSFPWSIYTFIDHRNDIKMFKTTVKPHAYDLWFHFHCLLVRDTHKNQAWSRGVGWGGVMDANILDSYFLKYQYARLLYMHTPNFWPALINKSVQPFFSLLWLEKSPL